LVDWSSAFETVGGQRDLLVELIQVFLKESDRMLESIEKAVQDQDVQNVRISAHSVKGALGHLGALSTSVVAGEIETKAGSENVDFDSLRPLIDQLTKNVADVSSEYRKFIGSS